MKHHLKRNVPKQPPRMSAEEKRLALMWKQEDGISPANIANRLHRQISTITRFLGQEAPSKPIGQPPALTKEQVDRLERTVNDMVAKADAEYEVTFDMIRRRARIKACIKVVAKALHNRGYWFRRLRHKPILTPQDVKARLAFATKYRNKSKSWWINFIHLHLDNHVFKIGSTSSNRKLLAQRKVRGVLRRRGKSLMKGLVKSARSLKAGGRGVLVAGGVGSGKALVWHVIDRNWSGDVASAFYRSVVAPSLRAQHPHRQRFRILEDNDPVGNQSTKGIAAKHACKLSLFEIPKRSPDLNVLDYAVWSKVETLLRAQERRWPKARKETRAQYIRRLKQTVARLPASFIDRSIGDMQRRCQLLYKAKGGLFEEGGRPRKGRRPL